MRRPRITLRNLLIRVAVVAVLMALARFTGARLLGRRPGMYHGLYWYFDDDWKYHEIRANVITDTGGFIFGDAHPLFRGGDVSKSSISAPSSALPRFRTL